MSGSRIARVWLLTADIERLAGFYDDVLGFEGNGSDELCGGAMANLLGVAGARVRVLRTRLGAQELALASVTPLGRPFPASMALNDLRFQHCALLVSDMGQAYGRLLQDRHWTPISQRGPQKLPQSSGGVTAFKFRDPEGHPLELLETGKTGTAIDHTAISIGSTDASVAFYGRLGFAVRTQTLNRGPQQSRLDALGDPVVEVTALALPGAPSPHLELLCYCLPPPDSRARPLRSNDIAASWIEIELGDFGATAAELARTGAQFVSDGIVDIDGRKTAMVLDPDGHRLLLVSRR
jgi:catechol 2,3-dioxygenase-like lactoylglutathione lyase family enzyme